MSDFKIFVIALKKYLEEIGYKGIYERSKSYESFYENIKDLDCHDFRFFFFKAHYLYAIMDNKEQAKDYIDKSIQAIALINNDIDSSDDSLCENTPFLFVPIEGSEKYMQLRMTTLFVFISFDKYINPSVPASAIKMKSGYSHQLMYTPLVTTSSFFRIILSKTNKIM